MLIDTRVGDLERKCHDQLAARTDRRHAMLGEIERRAKLVSVHTNVFGRELPIERAGRRIGLLAPCPHWEPIRMPEGALIPDTLEGAFMLSVIDFFLSFIMIAGIGIVLAALPAINRLVRTPGDAIED